MRRWGKRRKSTILPVDVLAAVSKCSTVFVKFGNFVVVVVMVDAWAMTGFLVNCCDGGRFFLCTDGRITSILSPWGRWITVVVALEVIGEERTIQTRQWIIYAWLNAYPHTPTYIRTIAMIPSRQINKFTKHWNFSHLRFGRFDVFAFGGRGLRIGGLKSKCWWWVSTRFSVRLSAQHEPNINESTHIPTCWPSDLMHSQTNMHVPP